MENKEKVIPQYYGYICTFFNDVEGVEEHPTGIVCAKNVKKAIRKIEKFYGVELEDLVVQPLDAYGVLEFTEPDVYKTIKAMKKHAKLERRRLKRITEPKMTIDDVLDLWEEESNDEFWDDEDDEGEEYYD